MDDNKLVESVDLSPDLMKDAEVNEIVLSEVKKDDKGTTYRGTIQMNKLHPGVKFIDGNNKPIRGKRAAYRFSNVKWSNDGSVAPNMFNHCGISGDEAGFGYPEPSAKKYQLMPGVYNEKTGIYTAYINNRCYNPAVIEALLERQFIVLVNDNVTSDNLGSFDIELEVLE